MLIGKICLENFSSLSFLYIVHGLARLNISLALALHSFILLGIGLIYANLGITDLDNIYVIINLLDNARSLKNLRGISESPVQRRLRKLGTLENASQ
jgi:hypothetical protein